MSLLSPLAGVDDENMTSGAVKAAASKADVLLAILVYNLSGKLIAERHGSFWKTKAWSRLRKEGFI